MLVRRHFVFNNISVRFPDPNRISSQRTQLDYAQIIDPRRKTRLNVTYFKTLDSDIKLIDLFITLRLPLHGREASVRQLYVNNTGVYTAHVHSKLYPVHH